MKNEKASNLLKKAYDLRYVIVLALAVIFIVTQVDTPTEFDPTTTADSQGESEQVEPESDKPDKEDSSSVSEQAEVESPETMIPSEENTDEPAKNADLDEVNPSGPEVDEDSDELVESTENNNEVENNDEDNNDTLSSRLEVERPEDKEVSLFLLIASLLAPAVFIGIMYYMVKNLKL
jgi:hypothetical protein